MSNELKIGDKITHNGMTFRIKSDFGCGEFVIENVTGTDIQMQARNYAENCIMGDLDRPHVFEARMDAFIVGAKAGATAERERTRRLLTNICDIPEVYAYAILRLIDDRN